MFDTCSTRVQRAISWHGGNLHRLYLLQYFKRTNTLTGMGLFISRILELLIPSFKPPTTAELEPKSRACSSSSITSPSLYHPQLPMSDSPLYSVEHLDSREQRPREADSHNVSIITILWIFTSPCLPVYLHYQSRHRETNLQDLLDHSLLGRIIPCYLGLNRELIKARLS